MLARDLREFPRLDRKAVRVVVYDGLGRMQTVREYGDNRGYAAAFQSVIAEVVRSVPVREEIVDGLRRERTEYPEIAVRELVANALVHQDLSVHGAGPMVEVFTDRIEISNPGRPVTKLSEVRGLGAGVAQRTCCEAHAFVRDLSGEGQWLGQGYRRHGAGSPARPSGEG